MRSPGREMSGASGRGYLHDNHLVEHLRDDVLLNRGALQRSDRLGVQLRPHHSRAILAERLAELTYARQGVKALSVKALRR